MDSKELEKALAKAKFGIFLRPDTVFFATLCSSLKTSFTERVQTASTNGLELFINPQFFMELDLQERVFLLAHETLHVAYKHMLRGEGKDQRIFNMAADFVINLELHQRKFKFIKGGLLDARFEGMSTEQVYNRLIEQQQQQQQQRPQSGDGEGGSGDSEQIPWDDPFALEGDLLPPDPQGKDGKQPDKAQIEQQVQEAIQRAAMTAQMYNQAGTIPGEIRRELARLAKPKVNWKVVLSRFFHDNCKEDYTWKRLNRRFVPDMLIPSLYSEQLARIDFAIDVSGSIGKKEFDQFVTEVHYLMRAVNPECVGVYQFDHRLTGNDVVRSLRDIQNIQFKGGGGTRPQEALEAFKSSPAIAMVVLTDGYFHINEHDNPKKPVIWVVYNNEEFKAPFGTTVHYQLSA